ncbi:hypothetical protein TgHK011_001131 [Trichoderma gracile]|nr:hypothetical protein TgHK011_001131 [Trichoderma gracile]
MASQTEYVSFSPLQSQASRNSYVVWSGGSTSRPPAKQLGQAALSAGGGVVKYKGKYMLLTVNNFLGDSETEALVILSHMAEEGHSHAFELLGARFFRYGSIDMDSYVSLQWSQQNPTSAPAGNGGCRAAASAITSGQLCDQIKAILRTPKLQYALFEVDSKSVSPSVLDNAISLDNDDMIEPGPRSTRVITVTPTSGTVEGTLGSTTWIIRPPGTEDCIEVLLMRCPALRSGDRGSLVVDKETGRLFGHIIHYFAPAGLALVMPAKFVAEHARQVLDQRAEARTTPAPTTTTTTTTTQQKWVSGLGIVRLLSRFSEMERLRSISAVTIPRSPENLPHGEIVLRYNLELGDGPPGALLTRPFGLGIYTHRPTGARPMSIRYLYSGYGTITVPLIDKRRAGDPWIQRLETELRRHSAGKLLLAISVFEVLGTLLLYFGGDYDFFVGLCFLCVAASCVCFYGIHLQVLHPQRLLRGDRRL